MKDAKSDSTFFFKNYIEPLINIGMLKLTIPDKPKSKFQKIVVDEKYFIE